MSNHDSVLLLHLSQSPKSLIETETKKTLDEEDIVKKIVFTSLLNTLELQVQQHFFLNKGSSQLQKREFLSWVKFSFNSFKYPQFIPIKKYLDLDKFILHEYLRHLSRKKLWFISIYTAQKKLPCL